MQDAEDAYNCDALPPGLLGIDTRLQDSVRVHVRVRHHGMTSGPQHIEPSGRVRPYCHKDSGVLTLACDSEACSPARSGAAQSGWMRGVSGARGNADQLYC